MEYNYKYDEMFLEADHLISDQQIKEAMSLLHQIIDEQPDYGRAHNHLGWIYENKLKRFDKAADHYQAALHFSPGYPAPWLNYAYFLSNLQRYKELKEHLEKCLTIPGIFTPYIYNEFAIMNELQENYPEATEYYVKAIKKSLNAKDIEGYEESIERVKKKMNL